MEIEVKWSGKWPCFCNGAWTIKVDGKEIDIPDDKKNDNMGTYGEYTHRGIDLSSGEEWSRDYTDGDTYPKWIEKNLWLLENLRKALPEISSEDLAVLTEQVFDFIQANDFRPGCCGGCI